MTTDKHNLHSEFPELADEIHYLKMNDNRFYRRFTEYYDVVHEVSRITQGIENTSDEYLEGKKKLRLKLKDELHSMLKKIKVLS